ncbi:MAG: response regulator transcription factor [Anaerolineae bacterium]|nr:response regulator transcription factor [Anaerolineae bacterium]
MKGDVSVLIVDDQRLIREGISSLLALQDGVIVVGTAVNGQEAITKAERLQPNVVLMDVRMPVMDGITATVQIKQLLPDSEVIMLTTFDDDEYIIKSLQAGASGYLLKDIPAADLAQAIKLAHAGIYQLDTAVAGKLVGALSKQKMKTAPLPETARAEPAEVADSLAAHDLTERELEVLHLIATGATNREIADKLVVSEGTVKNHVSSILSRLGLRDRTQAALYAHQHNLI